MTRHRPTALLFTAAAVVLVFPAVASAQVVVEGIAAVVNDDIILLSKLRERAQPIAAEAARKSLSQEITPDLEKQAFRHALSEEFLRNFLGTRPGFPPVRLRPMPDRPHAADRTRGARNTIPRKSEGDFVSR